MVSLPERYGARCFTEGRENYLRRLNRYAATNWTVFVLASMHHSVRDNFEADDTEGYQRGAEDHRRSALFQRSHRD